MNNMIGNTVKIVNFDLFLFFIGGNDIEMGDFKLENDFASRVEVARKILASYPDRVPVIVETKNKELFIKKKKFLAPDGISVAKFIQEVRKHITIGAYDGLYLFVGDTLLSPGGMMSSIYKRHKDDDGFLYITISKESSFGHARIE